MSLCFCLGTRCRRPWFSLTGKIDVRGEDGASYSAPGPGTTGRVRATRSLKGLQYIPRVLVTDKLQSYAAAKREVLPGVEHRQSRYLNNRAELSHQPTRRRERIRPAGTAWHF